MITENTQDSNFLKRNFDYVDGSTAADNKKIKKTISNQNSNNSNNNDDENNDENTEIIRKNKNTTNDNNNDPPIIDIPTFNFNKFCYRHDPDIQSNATYISCYKQDKERIFNFNNKLSKLNLQEQSDIHHIISKFNNSNDKLRKIILDGILSSSCFPQLSYISQQLKVMIKIDFISILPQELSLKILSYLDCESLCQATMVCRKWKILADNDKVWYHLCQQHIDRKCPNCGWGLPLLHMKNRAKLIKGKQNNLNNNNNKNLSDSNNAAINNTINSNCNNHIISNNNQIATPNHNQIIPNSNILKPMNPWKIIYRDRFKVELNWRKGKCNIKDFKGHMDGILTLKFNFRFLFTGSYDSTIAIWDLFTGNLIRRLNGHEGGVKTLFFDGQKLITGSLDKTIRVWNYINGQCISTYRGHSDSVMSVDSYKKIIVSGSADKTVKIWHVESRTCYTLRGHTEWVNCVKLHPKSFTCYSCSDDTTIKMWDIRTNTCLKTFTGHVGQVQKVIPLTILDIENLVVDTPSIENDIETENDVENVNETENVENIENQRDNNDNTNNGGNNCNLDENIPYPTHLLSCSLDNTIKLWEVKTGKCIRTHFGHVEGVWDIAADNFRIISGSHDGCIKVWDLQSGQCIHTFHGKKLQKDENNSNNNASNGNTNNNNNGNGNNQANTGDNRISPIACVDIGDSEFFTGDEAGCVKMYKFDLDDIYNDY